MNVKYRIIEKYPLDRQIVVRFFTDVCTENYLSVEKDSVTGLATNLGTDGNPIRCRTDVAITLPTKQLNAEEEKNTIMAYCMWKWLEDEERIINSKTVTDVEIENVVSAISNMSDTVGVLVFNPPKTLQEKKDLMWEKIKLEREKRESGGYLVGTTWYHSDSTSLMKYNTLLSMAVEKSLPANTVVSAAWKNMHGTFSPMTVSTLRSIRDVGIMKVAEIYAAAETHRANMELLEDPTTYNYLVGWPTIFGE